VADQNKFGQKPDTGRGETRGTGPLRCDDWEAMLTDALDGELGARERAAFEAHAGKCAGCADLLAHARQGQEWLEYLHSEPEIPASLVSKILDKTAGAGAIPVPLVAGVPQGAGAAAAIPWRRSFQETRLLMTVAMAFFSIALTLNMAGIKLTSLRLADLRPTTIGNSLSRSFYAKWGQVSRFYNNARFVYQLESKMRELRRDSDTAQPAPQKKVEPSSRNGESQGPGLSAQSSEEPGGISQPALNGVQRSALSTQAGTTGGEPSQNRQPHALNTSVEFRGTGEQKQHGTEVKKLNLLDKTEAGPRRTTAAAGCDGRSLA
jgi:hypothetical protein